MITSYYGERTDPFGSGEELHNGIDIGVPMGTEVCAASSGVVTEVGSSQSWGNYLRYRADDGKTVIYAHLDKVLAEENDKIKQGDAVAVSGCTGASTGPHLHFGVYENGESIDPMTVTKESDYRADQFGE